MLKRTVVYVTLACLWPFNCVPLRLELSGSSERELRGTLFDLLGASHVLAGEDSLFFSPWFACGGDLGRALLGLLWSFSCILLSLR